MDSNNDQIKQMVDTFSARMHKKIMQRQERWGKTSWKKADPLGLLAHLNKEVAELVEEIAKTERGEKTDPELLLMEAVDIANLAMMIADRYATITKEKK